MLVYTCEQMRVIEENASVGGFSYIDMMENAGKRCAEKINYLLSEVKGADKSVVILCGSGKNGGDGYVIARILCDKGYSVRVVLVNGEPVSYESKVMYSYLDNKPVLASDLRQNYSSCVSSCMSATAVIDCVFGIGFHGQLDEQTARFFSDISKTNAINFAIDIPSGLEGNSGEENKEAFIADYTLAITCYKPAHIFKPAAEYCGKLVLIDIGIPHECYEAVASNAVVSADTNEIKHFFKPRETSANKGDFGKLLCITGSRNMQGAAVMAAQAAVNSGVGLVVSVFPKSAYSAIAAKLTEPLTVPMSETADGYLSRENLPALLEKAENSTAILLGCGLGVTDDTKEIVYEIIRRVNKPIILDADGINAVAENINVLKETSAQIIITPHPGEMARLTGMTVEAVQRDRAAVAKTFSTENNCTVVLKGANTIVASPTGNVYINRTGNPGMATGGSGDVLAGIISSFVCQSMGLQSASIAAVYVHGMCGDNVMKKLSMRGVTPTRMIDELAEVLSNFE